MRSFTRLVPRKPSALLQKCKSNIHTHFKRPVNSTTRSIFLAVPVKRRLHFVQGILLFLLLLQIAPTGVPHLSTCLRRPREDRCVWQNERRRYRFQCIEQGTQSRSGRCCPLERRFRLCLERRRSVPVLGISPQIRSIVRMDPGEPSLRLARVSTGSMRDR